MTNPMTYLKLPAFWALSFLPGTAGAAFETRWHWARRGLFTDAAMQAFEQSLAALGPESLCVDLGANVGTISEKLLAHAGRVHAFEPDPWTFAQLEARVGANPGATLHNAAIGAHDGTLKMMRDPGFEENRTGTSQGTSAFRSLLWGEGEPEMIEVELIDIRRFLRELDRPVDLMKIDIEGAEVELLEALLEAPERALVREIFVETHEPQMPELRARTKALRTRVREQTQPLIHLDWQ